VNTGNFFRIVQMEREGYFGGSNENEFLKLKAMNGNLWREWMVKGAEL